MEKLILLFVILSISLLSCQKDNSTDNLTNLEFVEIQAGTFEMGCTDNIAAVYSCDSSELLVHTVTLNDFKLGKYEVTNAQYVEFLNGIGAESNGFYDDVQYLGINGSFCKIEYNGNDFVVENGRENYPVVEVSWFGANAYCQWAGGRLPTEAEWEYAARGGGLSQGYVYSGSDNADEVAWYNDNSGNDAHEVGTKKANELGLYDMSGNVWEWCNDWYDDHYYTISSSNNPQGPENETCCRVGRGGAWSDAIVTNQVSYRSGSLPANVGGTDLGFRCAKDF